MKFKEAEKWVKIDATALSDEVQHQSHRLYKVHREANLAKSRLDELEDRRKIVQGEARERARTRELAEGEKPIPATSLDAVARTDPAYIDIVGEMAEARRKLARWSALALGMGDRSHMLGKMVQYELRELAQPDVVTHPDAEKIREKRKRRKKRRE